MHFTNIYDYKTKCPIKSKYKQEAINKGITHVGQKVIMLSTGLEYEIINIWFLEEKHKKAYDRFNSLGVSIRGNGYTYTSYLKDFDIIPVEEKKEKIIEKFTFKNIEQLSLFQKGEKYDR